MVANMFYPFHDDTPKKTFKESINNISDSDFLPSTAYFKGLIPGIL